MAEVPASIDPVLSAIDRKEYISDPFVREAYFGSPDTPGLIAQATNAANRAYGTPFQAQGVAGFSPFANRAMEGAYAGIGGYKPYLGAYEDALRQGMDTIGQRKGLINEALGATRQSGEIQQPYFAQAEKQLQDGMQNLASSYGRQGPSARDYQRASLQGFDPRSASAYELPSQFMLPFVSSARGQTAEGINALMGGAVREQQMGTRALGELQRGVGQDQAYRKRGLRELTGAGDEARMIAREIGRSTFDPRDTSRFYDPFEDRVVQQTIDDAFKQSDIQDVAQRARDIQSGGESAFGSRARLTADERRSALGRGLGEALAGIRSGGFQRAQSTALDEFGRQVGARERLAGNLAGYGTQFGDIGGRRAAVARNVGSDIAGYGGQIGNLGRTDYDLASSQRRELADLGGTARGIKETGLGRQYDQAVQTRMAPMQAASYVQGFLPQYTPGFSNVQTTYGAPPDPLSGGLSTFLGTYANFANPKRNPTTDPTQDPVNSGNQGGPATQASNYGNPFGQYNPYGGGGTYTT